MNVSFDVDQVVAEIVSGLRGVAQKNAGKIASFADEQARLLAESAAKMAEALANGSYKVGSSQHKFFQKMLVKQTADFAASVGTLIAISVQEAYDLITRIVWSAIQSATGITKLVPPAMPS